MPKYLLFWWKEEGKASKKKKFDSFQYIAFRPKVKTSAFFLCDEGVRIEGKGWEWKIAIGNKSMFALYNEAFPAPYLSSWSPCEEVMMKIILCLDI